MPTTPPIRRYYANGAPAQTLSAPITSGSVSLVITGSFTGWPVSFPFMAVLDRLTPSAEIVLVTSIVGTTANITRAQDGTVAVAHTTAATFEACVVKRDLDEANAHLNATTGIHGISGAVVGTTDTQTLTNKTLTSPILASAVMTSPTTDKLTATGAILSSNLRTQITFNDGTTLGTGVAGGPFFTIMGASSTGSVDVDTLGAYTTTTGVWTVPASSAGVYVIEGSAMAVSSTSTGVSFNLYLNGSIIRAFIGGSFPSGATLMGFTLPAKELTLAVGDQITVRSRTVAAAGPPTYTLWSPAGETYIRIERKS